MGALSRSGGEAAGPGSGRGHHGARPSRARASSNCSTSRRMRSATCWTSPPSSSGPSGPDEERQRLRGKNVALIFEKTSTRTRAAFEVAAYDQGAHVTYLDPAGSQMGHKESVKDTARVLGRIYDGIEYRGFSQATVETLARLRRRARCGTGSPTSSIPRRSWPTCSPCASTAPSRSSRSRTATWATPATTWATRSWWAAASSAWTCGCARRRTSGRPKIWWPRAGPSPPRPAPA